MVGEGLCRSAVAKAEMASAAVVEGLDVLGDGEASAGCAGPAVAVIHIEVTVVRSDATRATVQLQGEMDLANACLLSTVLDSQLARGSRFLRLEVSGLSFLDCAGLDVAGQQVVDDRGLGLPNALEKFEQDGTLLGAQLAKDRILDVGHDADKVRCDAPPLRGQ